MEVSNKILEFLKHDVLLPAVLCAVRRDTIVWMVRAELAVESLTAHLSAWA